MSGYALCSEGRMHTADVRFVDIFRPSPSSSSSYDTVDNEASRYIVSASRDLTARVTPFVVDHHVIAEMDATDEGKVFVGHTAFVNFALVHPSLCVSDLDMLLHTSQRNCAAKT
uniref:Histidine--tRNA ligase n=1 Tax=Lygus hesperus TaxID=30085 RepID=A0A0A9WB47_LYGHE